MSVTNAETTPPFALGDFAAWFEAWIGDRRQIFDPRNNVPRGPRPDGAITTTFRSNTLESFWAWTNEIPDGKIVKAAD